MPSLKNLVALIAGSSVALGAAIQPQIFGRADEAEAGSSEDKTCNHTVKAGYRAQSIGEMYGTDRAGIIALNGNKTTEDGHFPLSPGDVLQVPCVEPNPDFFPDTSGPCLKKDSLTEEELADIPEGEKCFAIGRIKSVGAANLQAWNPDLPSFQDRCDEVEAGTEFCVAHFENPPCAQTHEVKGGDEQEAVAKDNGIDVKELERLNPNLLFKGFLSEGYKLCVKEGQAEGGEQPQAEGDSAADPAE
ncbi:hypothetical protein CDD83_3686 [Cordyceps sp. RAO-2017]|nr:hypothetical protein CDD83_3686 [Cordyceps sp. RAO-2017]